MQRALATNSRPVIQWTRFWSPMNVPIRCGEDGRGFFDDPEGDHFWPPNTEVRRLDALMPEVGPLILCGDPGIGKTAEFRALKSLLEATREPVIALTSRLHISSVQELWQRTVEHKKWEAWKCGNGTLTLMIDGVDEGLLRISNLVSAFRGLLEDEPVERLRLILTCRSAEWPDAQGSALIALWPIKEAAQKCIFELCPLRHRDVQLAATNWGIEADEFSQAIWRAQVVGLASRPVTLFMLLDLFRSHSGLPSSHRALYEAGTRKLAQEVDVERMEILRRARGGAALARCEERIKAARRMASYFLCCRRRGTRRSPSEDPSDAGLELSLEEGFSSSSALAIAADEVIESALFTSIGEGSFGFAHQTFAECLASAELATLPLPQVRRLLMSRDDRCEYVVPQLIELAAWTAGRHRQFCDNMLLHDPTALLHCDASVLDEDTKERLVEAILRGAAEGRILDDHQLYRFFHTLKHQRLDVQLRPYIEDRSFEPPVRRIAIEVAQRCGLPEFTDTFLRIAHDEEDPVRVDAVEALCETAPHARLSELEPLARGEVGRDPRQEIRGYALRRLIPKHWSVTEALLHIQPRGDSRFHGAYSRFLDTHLPKHLISDHVPAALAWLKTNPGALDSLSSPHNFAQRVIELATTHLDSPEIAGAFAEFCFDLANNDSWQAVSAMVALKKLADDDEGRRRLLRVLLDSGRSLNWQMLYLFSELKLVRSPGDFAWLLDGLTRSDQAVQGAWIEVIAQNVWDVDLRLPNWDKFLDQISCVPLLGQRFDWLRAWDMNEPIARHHKAQHLKNKRQRARFQKRSQVRWIDPRPHREEALERARHDPADGWYQLWHVLHFGDSQHDRTGLTPMAVETYPGWKLLSEDERRLVKRSARLFLTSFSGDTATWKTGSKGSFACTAAMWLVRDELQRDPELSREISRRWIRLFSGFDGNDTAEAKELFTIINAVSHEAAITALVHQFESSGFARPYFIRIAERCWDERYNARLKTLADSRMDAASLSEVIDEWKDLDATSAGDYALRWLNATIEGSQYGYHIALKAAMVTALLSRPREAFEVVVSSLEGDPALATSVWLEVFGEVETRKEEWWSHWPEELLATLYCHLRRIFPKRAEYLGDSDDDLIAPRTSLSWGTNSIPGRIADRASREACRALLRLMDALPEEVASLRWSYQRALKQCRRNEWEPPEVEEVRRLFDNAEARLIRSAQDLQEVVIESLNRFQLHLTGDTLPAVEELWSQLSINGSRAKQRRPKDEKVLQRAVARWLRDDLGCERGIVVNCEVEPRPGSFTDIYVEAVSRDGNGQFEKMTLVIEVKGCWHREVRTAMHTQLVNGYLRDNGFVAGIYLVGWFVCEAYPDTRNFTGAGSLDEARRWLEAEVSRYDGRDEVESVAGVVLDCRWGASAPSCASV